MSTQSSPVMVALLRGINVGRSGRLAMADLRDIASACGHTDVRTYIQSGNVVFRAAHGGTDDVADGLRAAIRDATSLDPEVHVRTHADLAHVVGANPFADRAEDIGHLHVTFLDGEPAPVELDPRTFEPEAWALGDRAVYLFLPGGIGRSPLATRLARGAGPTGTTRNWRTTTALLTMADELA